MKVIKKKDAFEFCIFGYNSCSSLFSYIYMCMYACVYVYVVMCVYMSIYFININEHIYLKLEYSNFVYVSADLDYVLVL